MRDTDILNNFCSTFWVAKQNAYDLQKTAITVKTQFSDGTIRLPCFVADIKNI